MRRLFLAYAAACALLCAAVYAVALGWWRGRAFDAAIFGQAAGTARLATVDRLSANAVHTIDVGSLVLLGGGLVLLALLRGRVGDALAAAVVIVGANVTTQLLKPALGRLDPLGGDALRAFHGSYPSGHATVAMSLALAAVLAAPAALKSPAALLGAAYAAAIGVSLLVQQWHYASDVAGGYLVAGSWAGLAAAALPRGGAGARVESVRAGIALAAAVVLAFLVVVVLALHRHPGALFHFEYRRHLLFAAVAVPLLALVVAAGPAALLQRVRAPR